MYLHICVIRGNVQLTVQSIDFSGQSDSESHAQRQFDSSPCNKAKTSDAVSAS